ncbi:MAG: DNA polymerase III subunit delta [Eubacteriales bacterium]|nr:DNA polymerase III subunit delta [Eubacteriales bacterium]
MKIIQQDIKNQTFKQIYLLYGSETYLVQQYKKNLLKALNPDDDSMNFRVFEGKGINVREVIDLCETIPFFAERRVILFQDTGFLKNKCDELADYLKEIPDYLYLVFAETEVDKRSRVYKAITAKGGCGYAAEFTTPDEKQLMTWVGQLLKIEHKKITIRDTEYLLSKTGLDMNTIRMEVEKLISYVGENEIVTAEDIDAICITKLEDRIFDMIRAVTERNQKRALDLYYDLLNLRVPPMKIRANMIRQYRQLLLIKQMTREGVAQPEIASKMKVSTYILKGLMRCVREYSESELKQALTNLVEADEAVKSGRLADNLSVELVIVEMSQKK